MNTRSGVVSTAILGIALTTPLFADTRSAAVCAVSLTPDQKLIYQSVVPDLKRDSDLPGLVRAKVMALVSAGRLSMSSAPDDAMSAVRCLRMVHQ